MSRSSADAAPGHDVRGQVVVITGPPGAGKTTVARLLVDELAPSVHLHCDDFWQFIRQGRISPYRPEAHRQNEIVIGVIVEAAFGYAAGGYQVICDGIVGPWFIDPFRTAAARGPALHYVVLRPDLTTTLDRAMGRGRHGLVDPNPIRSLHRQFTDIGRYEDHILDSSRLTPHATSRVIQRGLTGGSFRLADGELPALDIAAVGHPESESDSGGTV
jgi:chloramphenicol 3-O-phosphotransferase